MAIILDGKILAQKIKSELKTEVAALSKRYNCVPLMVNIMVGHDAGTCAYANSQKRVAEQIGINYELRELPENITQKEFISIVQDLASDKRVHGIMVHKPVPPQINYNEAANYVSIQKDLEGINVANIGKMLLGETKILPCTPASVMEHLYAANIPLRGKEAVVVGHSDIVGKPLSLLLMRALATVTVCHIATSEAGMLEEHVKRADILVVAVGKARLIKGEWIKPGAVVIDVGINNVDGKIVGDVDFESAEKYAGYITPVPGGVGPLTVVMLMRNGIEAFKQQQEGHAE
jgi:methylenetetrahydrofolate dehydrogenase (NADP+)/methenyltetrahydrofolate cyclohydrolase